MLYIYIKIDSSLIASLNTLRQTVKCPPIPYEPHHSYPKLLDVIVGTPEKKLLMGTHSTEWVKIDIHPVASKSQDLYPS